MFVIIVILSFASRVLCESVDTTCHNVKSSYDAQCCENLSFITLNGIEFHCSDVKHSYRTQRCCGHPQAVITLNQTFYLPSPLPPSPLPPAPCNSNVPISHTYQCSRGSQYCTDGSTNPYCIPQPNTDFVCPATTTTCDATIHPSTLWPTLEDKMFISGSPNTTDVPFEKRAVRHSSLDPCELVPAYDEVWTDGLCIQDAWEWRPMIDIVHTLLGMEHLFRLYMLEVGGPEVNYKRMECDFISYTNDGSSEAYWRQEIERAKNGNDVQIIDITGHFCTASEESIQTQYIDSGRNGASGNCQLYSGARYTIRDSDVSAFHGSIGGRYITTANNPRGASPFQFSRFEVAHEMIHLRQNAHAGRRLYMQHADDGECCTLNFEHMAYVTYFGYVTRLPMRFQNIDLFPPWNGWRIDEDLATGFQNGWIPSWWNIDYPDLLSENALRQRWHVATYVQSAYRLYTAVKPESSYRNHALLSFTCILDNSCSTVYEPSVVWALLSDAQKAYYSFEYAIVFDITYRLKNLVTTYFIYKANQHQPAGFGEYDFWNYELNNTENQLSENEMFALAGFQNRRVFLEDFHTWMTSNLNAQRTPLEVADEIIPTHERYVNDLERMKQKNKISDGPMCGDTPMPAFRFVS